MRTPTISKPQKSRKHKKIKAIDPFYDGDRPKDRKAEHYNLKPKNCEQEYSHKLREFTENKITSLKKKKNQVNKRTQEDNVGLQFSQRKREREKDFMRRVDRETYDYLQKTKLEDKYKINDGSCKVKSLKKKKHLQEKKQQSQEKKIFKMEDKLMGLESLKDDVKFGEVVMAPPKLQFESAETNKVKDLVFSKNPHKLKKKKKSLHEAVMLEEERKRVVDLYRKMKSHTK